KCHQNMRAPVPTGTVSLVAVLPTPVRNDGVGRYSAPVGDVAYADWCLHPQVIDQIWVRFFKAQGDLFANRQNTCCPLWFSLGGNNPPLGINALGHQWPALRLY